MRRSETEGHRCELNNSTHEGNEDDLEENPDYVYRGTKVGNTSKRTPILLTILVLFWHFLEIMT